LRPWLAVAAILELHQASGDQAIDFGQPLDGGGA